MKSSFVAFVLLSILIVSCESSQIPIPRPRMYPQISFPEGQKQTWTFDDCPFEFILPEYFDVEFDESDETTPANPCWFDLGIPLLKAKIHCSYYPIDKENTLENLVEDAYTFVRKHNIKATFRKETPVANEFGAVGMIFEIEGPVASPYQFYMTDENRHFLRGSLYFGHAIAQDSMMPIVEFIKNDFNEALATLRLVK